MENNNINKQYHLWMENADSEHRAELQLMSEEDIKDAFYKELSFGTGGLRGIMGAGINRMNVYTVERASQGLVNYIIKNFPSRKCSIAIAYDSRRKSDQFARVSAEVFAANNIKVYIYKELMPTPCLSYAIRQLKCKAGIMITASHNPMKYNGYKVYGEDGGQVTIEAAEKIQREISEIDIFKDVKKIDFDECLEQKKIIMIDESIYLNYVEEVLKESVVKESIDRDVSIVYSPLNGTGLKPVIRTLKEAGFTNITIVQEQEQPDGVFPTCPYPNPEIRDAMELGIQYCKRIGADILIATDPDCDRCGAAVRALDGSFRLLSGNEMGILLLDYICSQRTASHKMPENPVFIKTIVTTELAERIAESYGVRTINVLTGFKYIGEQIGILEQSGTEHRFILGFEESCGYLTGSYVRDKDGVNAALLICEMAAYYKKHDITLLDKLEELNSIYGYYLNTLHTYAFEGEAGSNRMRRVMNNFRNGMKRIGEKKVYRIEDYALGIQGLPKTDMIKYILSDNCSVVIRPSGTEPKLKVYISAVSNNKKESVRIEHEILKNIENIIK